MSNKYTSTLPARLVACLLIAGSPAALAVGIGKVTLHSTLGEPLLAQVDLQLSRGETIEDACITLSTAEDEAGNATDRAILNGLSAKIDPHRRRIEISSRKPFNEPFAIFRLQIQCPGMGSVAKTLTLLPDIGPAPQVSPLPTAGHEIAVTAAPTPATGAPAVPPTAQPATSSTATVAPLTAMPAPAVLTLAAPRPEKAARKHETGKPRNIQFQLKLSGTTLDMSRIGSLSAADREQLLAQQKLLDEDDQTARFLAMQHQLKLMQEEMNTVRLKLAKLESGASAVATSRTVRAEPSAPAWRNALLAAGLLAAIALVWLGLRYMAQRKAQRPAQDTAKEEPSRPVPHFAPEPIPPHAPDENAAEPILTASASAVAAAIQENPFSAEESAVLEEAELYAIHGHPDKAVRILHEFVAQHPASEKAWVLLLSIYSSRGQTEEFEIAAREFLRHHKYSAAWAAVQAQGRTLDQGNPLYIDGNNTGSFSPLTLPPQRPIGDILIELGHLSPQDMANCLQDFDPKRHGRFGNYLVTRQQISHAQLSEALFKQQTGEATLPPTAQLAGHTDDHLAPSAGSVTEQLLAPVDSGTSDISSRETAPARADDASLEFVLHFDTNTTAATPPAEHVAKDKSTAPGSAQPPMENNPRQSSGQLVP